MRLLVIATVMLLILSAAGFAGDPRDGCRDELTTSCSLRISVCPQGDFERIAKGCGGDSDYIEVVIYDSADLPWPGIPPTDFWMGACDAEYELATCAAPFFLADSMTGPNGRTTFSGRIAAGGCIPEGGIWVCCRGIVILEAPFCIVPVCADIVIVSPDINADGFVNLSDLSFFGESYNHQLGDPVFNTCCDYNDDDMCNLSDFSYVGEHYQHSCQ